MEIDALIGWLDELISIMHIDRHWRAGRLFVTAGRKNVHKEQHHTQKKIDSFLCRLRDGHTLWSPRKRRNLLLRRLWSAGPGKASSGKSSKLAVNCLMPAANAGSVTSQRFRSSNNRITSSLIGGTNGASACAIPVYIIRVNQSANQSSRHVRV
jgi:hypothetical protein